MHIPQADAHGRSNRRGSGFLPGAVSANEQNIPGQNTNHSCSLPTQDTQHAPTGNLPINKRVVRNLRLITTPTGPRWLARWRLLIPATNFCQWASSLLSNAEEQFSTKISRISGERKRCCLDRI